MIRSMTGYGTGSGSADGWNAEVALRTLNHRYFSLRVRGLSDPVLERRIEEKVKRTFTRGEIEVAVVLSQDLDRAGRLPIDREAVTIYATELRKLANELKLPPPTLGDLIALGVFAASGKDDSSDPWPAISAALSEAMRGAVTARTREGELLYDELHRIISELFSLVGEVKGRLPAVTKELRDRLRERIIALGAEVDPDRLEMEIAFIAERADVQEEVTRLEAHLTRIKELLNASGAVGKELGFLAQELLREANTLGAKSRDLTINGLVVSMKVAIERFKEQVQNVE